MFNNFIKSSTPSTIEAEHRIIIVRIKKVQNEKKWYSLVETLFKEVIQINYQ